MVNMRCRTSFQVKSSNQVCSKKSEENSVDPRLNFLGTGQAIHDSVIKGLKNIWPNEFPIDQIRLLITDQASTMILAGQLLKNTFTNMKHVTCLAHALHRVAEQINKDNTLTNSFIWKMQTILSHSGIINF